MVLVICGFYLLPQLKGAGLTLQAAVGGPYWVGVVVLGIVVVIGIASGGMKGITFVQAFQYWLKLTAIAVPALVLLMLVQHPPLTGIDGAASPTFHKVTKVEFPDAEVMAVRTPSPSSPTARSPVSGATARCGCEPASTTSPPEHARLPGGHAGADGDVAGGAHRGEWESPLVRLGGQLDHPLAATYGVILATFLGAIGLPHILVRFYTNPDGPAARKTTSLVLLLSGLLLCLSRHLRGARPGGGAGLYTSGPDRFGRPRPAPAGGGRPGRDRPGRAYCGRRLRRVPVDVVRPPDQHGRSGLPRPPRQGVRAFRLSAVVAGLVATGLGLLVGGIAINVLVGWAFAIAASSFCPLLLLGIWWAGLTWKGALWGLALGGGASSMAVILAMVGVGKTGWPAVLLGEPAILTVPLAFLTMVGVSLLTRRTVPPDVTRAVARPPPARTGPAARSMMVGR